MAVNTEQIRSLREATGAGIMDCKKALEESLGDRARAEALLKEWGLASVGKKAGREANQGVVESYIHAGGRVGALVEVNCETDFVARTADFRALAHDVALQVAAMNPTRLTAESPSPDGAESDVPLLQQPFIKDSGRTIQDLVNEAIAKLGENVVVRRFARFELGSD